MEFLQSFARLRPQLRELLERAMTEPAMTPNQLHAFHAVDYGVSASEVQYVRQQVAQQSGYEVHHATDDSVFYVLYSGTGPHWSELRPDHEMQQQARELRLAQNGRSH